MNWTAFLESRGAIFDTTGQVQGFETDPANEVTDYVADLSHLSLFDIHGDDAADFLHSQLTLNIHELGEQQAVLTAWCNPKGRVLASFILYRLSGAFGMLLSSDLGDVIGKRLQMYVLRASVQITDQSGTQPRIGVCGLRAAEQLERICGTLPPTPWRIDAHDDLTVMRLPAEKPRFLVTGPVPTLAGVWEQLEQTCQPCNRGPWQQDDIEAGLPLVTAATSELFLPQMLGLDHLGGLVYDKGCYPGQEVIARLHFRGEVKQRLRLGAAATAPPAPGTPLYGPDGQRDGTVINVTAASDGSRILAVAAPEHDQLHIGSESGDTLDFEPAPLQ